MLNMIKGLKPEVNASKNYNNNHNNNFICIAPFIQKMQLKVLYNKINDIHCMLNMKKTKKEHKIMFKKHECIITHWHYCFGKQSENK